MSDSVLDHAMRTQDVLRKAMSRLVAQPSVGGDPACAEGMEGARRELEALIRAAGFTGLRRLGPDPAPGIAPALYAERFDAPEAPTLLVYGHYDVQPADPVAAWNSPPLDLTERGGRLYGRGISDDKGPLLIALHALAAFTAIEGRLPVNVKLLIEGEEETGSPSMPGILADHAELLAADAMLSADGARWRADLVSLNVGSRGNGGFEMTLRTAAKDLHSGRYGGAVPNALHEMARLVAALHGADGSIAVPGFEAGIPELSPEERADLEAIPFDEDGFAQGLGSTLKGLPVRGTLERLWYRPTIEVNGMWGGHTGAGGKTVIPAEAHAKLTLRIAPGQDPLAAQAAVMDHLRAHCPEGADLHFHDIRQPVGAASVPADHPLRAACAAALEQTTGHRPLPVRVGASLPLTTMVSDALGIDTVMFSFSTSDEDFHAPNEFLRLGSIPAGLAAWIAALRLVGAQRPADYARFRR